MSMKMSMSLTPTLRMEQKIMFASRMLDLPVGTIDSLIENIAREPEKYDKMIEERKARGESGVQAFLPLLQKPSTKRRCRDGVIVSPELICDSISIKPEDLIDGIYSSQDPMLKPEFKPLEPLQAPAPAMQILQVPERYKNAASFFKYLIKERNWIVTTLRDIYDRIGSKQREFIGSLDVLRLNVYSMDELSKDLDFNFSTVFRLLRNRFIRVDGEKNLVFPSRELLLDRGDLGRYFNVFGANKILALECAEKNALSDKKFEQKTNLGRRTFTKYRAVAGIPKKLKRQRRRDLDYLMLPHR